MRTEQEQRSRALVAWCPDWPAVAAAREVRVSAAGLVAVFHANRVQACTPAARAEGIRIGMRRRDAQSRCPDLLIQPADPDRDGRLFEPVAAAMELLAPGVEVLRPGLVACAARGPVRYFGSESAAAEQIVDAIEALDVECRVGIADVLPVAVLAARHSVLVPPGAAAEFCAGLPITELARDPAIAPPDRTQLVDLLIRLGITTAGAFAALPEERVATRFGADAVLAHRLARGLADRGVYRRSIPADLTVEQICDPPLDRVDTAAFLARALAEQFHARLADAGLACTRLAITARTDRGQRLSRIWRCARPLTAAATADRLRWQLDGWLTDHRRLSAPVRPGRALVPVDGDRIDDDSAESGPGAITLLRLEPVEAVGSGLVQYGLWGSDGREDQQAAWSFARVQGLLGPESVRSPVVSGGRGPADRITLVSWGDERVPERDPLAPWPGAVPAPTPGRLTDSEAGRLALADAVGRPVTVTTRGMLSAPPALVDWSPLGERPVAGWAGPWLLDERWWIPPDPASARPDPGVGRVSAPAIRAARMQVLLADGPALLVSFGLAGWLVEGVYD